jgi:hypothetical protein
MLTNFYFPKTVFSHETPCIPVGIYRRFGRICFFLLQYKTRRQQNPPKRC